MYLKRIRDLREDNDYTQVQIANHLKISQRYYSNLENGQRTISAETLKELALFYNVSADYLLELTNIKQIK